MVKIVVDNAKCTAFGTCADICPVGVCEVKVQECLVCRACEVQCPESALQAIE